MPSLHRLVSLLRDTLPIVSELEDIREGASNGEFAVDTFAKAAGWYRVLYGDMRLVSRPSIPDILAYLRSRHALDFRLLSGHRVAILDGSQSLFGAEPTPDLTSSLGIQPIKDMNVVVYDSIRENLSLGVKLGLIAPIDVGVVCGVDAARALGRSIHDRILPRLNT